MITFDKPVLLIVLAVLPTAVYLRHFWPKRGGRISFSFTIWQKQVLPAPPLGTRLLFLLTSLMFWLGLVSLLTALAGPSITERERIYLSRGIDIMVVLDQSPSMAAQDFSPGNRFAVAKEVIDDFIIGRENDSIGLIGFGDKAAIRVPPTKDYPFLREQLDRLRLMELGRGTAIGMGLALACVHLRESTASRRIVVLVTDGENNAGEVTPTSATKIAAEMGIRVYTIGVGGREEAAIELEDPETGKIIHGTIESSFDEELLTSIADATGGRFFTAGNPTALRAVFEDLDARESVERRIRVRIQTSSIHKTFIMAGLLLILVSFFIRKVVYREVL